MAKYELHFPNLSDLQYTVICEGDRVLDVVKHLRVSTSDPEEMQTLALMMQESGYKTPSIVEGVRHFGDV